MLETGLRLFVDALLYLMLFRRYLQHEVKPELSAHPEDRAHFDQRNHQQVEKRWGIDLSSIESREMAAAQYMRAGYGREKERGE